MNFNNSNIMISSLSSSTADNKNQQSSKNNNNNNNNRREEMWTTQTSPPDDSDQKSPQSSSLLLLINKIMDDLVSSKLKNLSIQERSDGLHDLHGVSELKEENEEMIQKKLAEMNHALNVIITTTTTTTTTATTTTTTATTNSSTFTDIDIAAAAAAAYKQAVAKSPTYVEKFKIPCLRAEEYNSQEAAERLIRYFHRKQELFCDSEDPKKNEDKLVKDLTMEDLNDSDEDGKKDIEALERGVCQVLPQRDSAGRAIMFIHGPSAVLYETKTVMRVIFYLSMSALQDEETQRRGIVAIYYGVGQKTIIQGRTQQFWINWISIPWRLVAVHHCIDLSTAFSEGTMIVFFRLMKNQNVCRFRIHRDTASECIYKLMTFGIPNDSLPITVDNTMDLSAHHSMLQVLRHKEEGARKSNETITTSGLNTKNRTTSRHDGSKSSSFVGGQKGEESHPMTSPNNIDSSSSSSSSCTDSLAETIILIPDPMDVLMGRGRRPQSCMGLLRLHNLLLEYYEEYEKANKIEKTVVAEKVLKEMKALGSRFLAGTPGGYKECSDWVAREKISHGFRNLRLKKDRNISTRSLSPALLGDDDAPASAADSDSSPGDGNKKQAITTKSNGKSRSSRKRSFADEN